MIRDNLQLVIEPILFNRIVNHRMDGFTIEASAEIADKIIEYIAKLLVFGE